MLSNNGEPYRLTDENWIEWHTYVDGQLSLSKLDKYLDEPAKEGGVVAQHTTAEKSEAKQAVKFLRMHLFAKFFRMTEHCQTAYKIWTILKSHFQKGEKNAQLAGVRKLVRLATNPPPIEDLAISIRSIVSKIGKLEVGSETFMVGFYTALVPSELSDLRVMSLTAKEGDLTLTNAAAVVKNEVELKNQTQVVAAQLERKTFSTNEQDAFNRGKRRNKTKGDQKEDTKQLCTYCTRTNHTVDRCFFKQKAEQLGKQESKLKVTAIRQKICGLVERPDHNAWYLDSGSQSHSVNNDSGFVSLTQSHNVQLESAGGDDIRVEGVGSYRIKSRSDLTLELKDTIYAPGLIANFLSSGKLNNGGIDVLLRRDGVCLVLDDDGVVATGRLKGGMYLMDLGEKCNTQPKNPVGSRVECT